jgi:hypothetical protein
MKGKHMRAILLGLLLCLPLSVIAQAQYGDESPRIEFGPFRCLQRGDCERENRRDHCLMPVIADLFMQTRVIRICYDDHNERHDRR